MTTYGRSNFGADLLMCTTGSNGTFISVGEIMEFEPPSIEQDLIETAKMDGDGWVSQIPSGKKTLGAFDLSLNWVNSGSYGTLHKELMDAASSNGGTQWFKINFPLQVGGSSSVPSMIFKAFVNKFALGKINAEKPEILSAVVGIAPDGAPVYTNF